MASKQLIFGTDAKTQLRKGLKQLADAVRVTMGPTGRNVILQKSFGGAVWQRLPGLNLKKQIRGNKNAKCGNSFLAGLRVTQTCFCY